MIKVFYLGVEGDVRKDFCEIFVIAIPRRMRWSGGVGESAVVIDKTVFLETRVIVKTPSALVPRDRDIS